MNMHKSVMSPQITPRMQTYNQFRMSRGLMKEAPYGLNKLGKKIIHMSGASKENNYYDLDES